MVQRGSQAGGVDHRQARLFLDLVEQAGEADAFESFAEALSDPPPQRLDRTAGGARAVASLAGPALAVALGEGVAIENLNRLPDRDLLGRARKLIAPAGTPRAGQQAPKAQAAQDLRCVLVAEILCACDGRDRDGSPAVAARHVQEAFQADFFAGK